MVGGVRGWLWRRGPALAASALTAGALLASPSPAAASWLRCLGAAALAVALFRALAHFRCGGVDALCWWWWWTAEDARCRRVPRLDRRAVLVTGCDVGFGHATARRLHDAGVGRVLACVLDEAGAGAGALRALASERLCVVPCDVRDAASVARAADEVRRVLDESGGCELWAVVNNAGILTVGETEWMKIEDLQEVFDVNTLGQVRVTQAFLPSIRKARGRFVNLNSVASQLCALSLTPYTISKFATASFTKSLRCEMSKYGVTVHSIEPWIVNTNFSKNFLPLLKKKLSDLPPEVKKEYDEDYCEKLVKLAEFIYKSTLMPESKVWKVIDAIEDACLSKYPEDRYLPGPVVKCMDLFMEEFHHVQNWVIEYYFKRFK